MNVNVNKLLVYSCNEEVSESLRKSCLRFSSKVDVCSDRDSCLKYADTSPWELLILHAVHADGFILDTCEKIKKFKPVSPIIVVSENTDPDYSARFLYQGADDYIAIPWNDNVFEARVTVAIRRYKNTLRQLELKELVHKGLNKNELQPAVHDFSAQRFNKMPAFNNKLTADVDSLYEYTGDVRTCVSSREILVGNKPLRLTQTEFMLFSYLLKNKTRPCASVELLHNVLGYDDDKFLPTLHSHMCRLRRKIKHSKTTTIETIWCYGYRIAMI